MMRQDADGKFEGGGEGKDRKCISVGEEGGVDGESPYAAYCVV